MGVRGGDSHRLVDSSFLFLQVLDIDSTFSLHAEHAFGVILGNKTVCMIQVCADSRLKHLYFLIQQQKQITVLRPHTRD